VAKDVTFAEDASQIRRNNSPAITTVLRDLVWASRTLARISSAVAAQVKGLGFSFQELT
jgi:hypothetical protein